MSYSQAYARVLRRIAKAHLGHIDAACLEQAAAHMEALEAKVRLLTDALWKACGDDEEMVEATIESQRN